jgi:amino acid transporter
MLVPFGFLVVYAVIALKQLAIGKKEDSLYKKRGARKVFLLSISGMLVVVFAWMLIMSKI